MGKPWQDIHTEHIYVKRDGKHEKIFLFKRYYTGPDGQFFLYGKSDACHAADYRIYRKHRRKRGAYGNCGRHDESVLPCVPPPGGQSGRPHQQIQAVPDRCCADDCCLWRIYSGSERSDCSRFKDYKRGGIRLLFRVYGYLGIQYAPEWGSTG